MTISGSDAATSSQVMRRESVASWPSGSFPPAVAIISGTQCPAQKSGSVHSRNVIGRASAPATASRTRASRARFSSIRRCAASSLPVALPIARMFSSISAKLRGVSESTCGGLGRSHSARLSSLPEGAQTWQRSWVNTMSGLSCASRTSSISYRLSPVARCAATARSISFCESPSSGSAGLLTTGSERTSGG